MSLQTIPLTKNRTLGYIEILVGFGIERCPSISIKKKNGCLPLTSACGLLENPSLRIPPVYQYRPDP